MEDETIKKLKEERKKKLRRRLLIGTVAIVIIAVVISAYAFYEFTRDTYWKPMSTLDMPHVNWNRVNGSIVFIRKYFDEANWTTVQKMAGKEVNDKNFRVMLLVNLKSYLYDPDSCDRLETVPILYANKIGGDYVVKELVFRYDLGDDDFVASYPHYYGFKAKNLYFLDTEGNFPYSSYKLNSEWVALHQLRGINKDAKDIKECGFSWDFEIDMYDAYPHWVNHTITLTATLYYGHPTIFGWQDVHKLSTSVVIYVVPEGGE